MKGMQKEDKSPHVARANVFLATVPKTCLMKDSLLTKQKTEEETRY